jgi:hypothetical protein
LLQPAGAYLRTRFAAGSSGGSSLGMIGRMTRPLSSVPRSVTVALPLRKALALPATARRPA